MAGAAQAQVHDDCVKKTSISTYTRLLLEEFPDRAIQLMEFGGELAGVSLAGKELFRLTEFSRTVHNLQEQIAEALQCLPASVMFFRGGEALTEEHLSDFASVTIKQEFPDRAIQLMEFGGELAGVSLAGKELFRLTEFSRTVHNLQEQIAEALQCLPARVVFFRDGEALTEEHLSDFASVIIKQATTFDEPLPGEGEVVGHPRCTSKEDCQGSEDDTLIRHKINGKPGDIYCRVCWTSFLDQNPTLEGVTEEECRTALRLLGVEPEARAVPSWTSSKDKDKQELGADEASSSEVRGPGGERRSRSPRRETQRPQRPPSDSPTPGSGAAGSLWEATTFDEPLPGQGEVVGHPRCTSTVDCQGSEDDPLIRHILNGKLGDVYCRVCWTSFLDQNPTLEGVEEEDE